MPSLLRVRKGSPPWNASDLGQVFGQIADDICVAVCVVDGALRTELDSIEVALADIRRTQPNVQLPDIYACKDPHRRIRHEHDLLCIEAPLLAGRLGHLAQTLILPTAPEICVPAFDLRKRRSRASPIINIQASQAAIVREARERGWASFEDGSASVQSVANALTGSSCRLGHALLELSTNAMCDGGSAVRELADVVYFSGSRLQAIANLVTSSSGTRGRLCPGVSSIVESVCDLQKAMHGLDARMRRRCLFDKTPRGQHSPDVVYQAVVTALADAEFDDQEIARLIVPTSTRDRRLWERRVGDHVRKGDLAPQKRDSATEPLGDQASPGDQQ